MSSRGRGYSGRNNYGGRGGYRGSTYRGSNPRGSYESRGRGGYNTNYNSENRYNSSGGDRYNAGRDRIDSYKKPYRSESSSNYSSRDYLSRGGSPDRKRMRLEGSSDRRSHDGGGHFGSSYGSRQESYGERRQYTEERRRSPSRDSYRKSTMPPPRSPTRMSTPRSRVARGMVHRPYRGRTMRTRSTYRGTIRSRASYYPRRFSDRTNDYSRTFQTTKLRSSVKVKEDSASSTEGEDWEADDKDDTEMKEVKVKSPKSEGDVERETSPAAGDTDKEVDDEPSDTDLPRSRFTGRKFIPLFCVHCKEKFITFKGYSKHLLTSKHRLAMGGVARKHKAQLLRMRIAQRAAQREMEEADDSELTAETMYCIVCKLNYRTTRQAHTLSEEHVAMKKLLMPSCRICKINFRSPMYYEHHICSLEHIMCKARQKARPISPKPNPSADEPMDVDLDNFMTLDSVGDVDEVDDDDSGTDKPDEDKKTAKKTKEINIGSEHVKKVEVMWCELCKIYLRRTESGSAEEADTLRRHCRLRAHLGRYVKHRDTRTLRRQAERIHLQLRQSKESAKDEEAGEDKEKVEMDGKKKPAENGNDLAEAEDKLWADVDKDIGELLREVDPGGNKSSDDEEDLGRYDKFRKDKKLEGGAIAAGEGQSGAEGVPVEGTATPI